MGLAQQMHTPIVKGSRSGWPLWPVSELLFWCLPQVYVMYAGLLLSAFNRLPFRLPNRQLAGRKHKGNDSSSSSVTFADVAGVDEAKEELQEIVVS
jgi:ATP-dependent Zn protease